MPSVSKKQHNLMAAVAHSPAFAKKVGIKQSVGKDFVAADKGKKFAKGGETMKAEKAKELRHAKTLEKLAKEERAEAAGMKKGGMTKCCGGGKIKKMAAGGLSAGHKSADGIATKGKTRGTQVAMKKGGKC